MIKSCDPNKLVIGDLIICRDTKEMILSRVYSITSGGTWSPFDYQIWAKDVKIFNVEAPTNEDGTRMINNVNITYYGNITEEVFYEQYPEYKI